MGKSLARFEANWQRQKELMEKIFPSERRIRECEKKGERRNSTAG